MKPELEKLCTNYTVNREAVHKAFRWDDGTLYSVCASILCACEHTADPENLKKCCQVIKSHTKPFSRFRSRMIRSILSCMLAVGEEDPDRRMDRVKEYYRLLKRQFKGTEYLVLTSFLLTDLADRTLTEETVSRGRELYRRMNRKHRLLTDKTDSVFALLMAFSGRTDDELDADTEACYQSLKHRFSGSGGAQTASQILSLSPGTSEEKTKRVIDLYDALHKAEVPYGQSAELAPLAALTLAGTPVSALAEEITEIFSFLKDQTYYENKDSGRALRAVHAAMIVSDQYAGTEQVNVTVMTNTLDMLITKQKFSRLSMVFHLVEFAAKLFLGRTEQEKAADDESKNPSGSEKSPGQ